MIYDLVVIGGGITGLAVYERAARAGLSALLLERGRAGGATTAATSGLFHGGLRYLPYDVATSYAMCREIARLRRERPDLLSRQPFLWPVYQGHRYGLGLVESLQEYYDLFGSWRGSRPHVRLSAAEALAAQPGLNPRGLLGSLAFDEWTVNVAGLVASLKEAAAAAGGELREQSTVASFVREGGLVAAVRTTEEAAISRQYVARVFVNAAGPWAEEVSCLAGGRGVRLSLRKGVHLVVPGRAPFCGLTFPDERGHYIGLYPRAGEFLVGPNDDAYEGAPDGVSVLPEEEAGLKAALAKVLPDFAAKPARVIVGLRPIFRQRAAGALLSRDYRIYDHAAEGAPNLLTVTGGKLTSHRRMAQDVLGHILAKLGRPAPSRARDGGPGFPWSVLGTRRRSVSLAVSGALLAYYTLRHCAGAGRGRAGLAAFRENYGGPRP